MPALNSKLKYEKLAAAVLQNTQNLVISPCCFAEDGKKCTKIYNARAQLLLSSLNLFSDVVLLSWFSYPYSLCSCEDLPKTKVVPKTVKTPNTVIQCTVMYNREHFHVYESGNWNATSAKLSKHEELWSASVTFSKSLAVWCGIRKRDKFPGNNTAINEVHPGKKKIMYFIQYR